MGLYASGELRRPKPARGPREPSRVHRGSFEGWFAGLRVGLKVRVLVQRVEDLFEGLKVGLEVEGYFTELKVCLKV